MCLSQHMLAWTPRAHQLPGAQEGGGGGQPRPQVCGGGQARRMCQHGCCWWAPCGTECCPHRCDHMEPSQGSRTFSFVIQAREKGVQKVLSNSSNHVSRLATSHPGWDCQAGGGWLPEIGGGVPDTSAMAGVGVHRSFTQYTHKHSCAQTHTLLLSHTASPLSVGVHDKGVDGSLCPCPTCACASDDMGDTAPPPQARETLVMARPDARYLKAAPSLCVGIHPLVLAAATAVTVAVLAGDKVGCGPRLAKQPPVYNRLGVGRGSGAEPARESHICSGPGRGRLSGRDGDPSPQ